MRRTVLAIGLPKTGKTTFLAALWGVVSSDEIPGSLTLERMDGDMQYLNEIHKAWADCKSITRTGPASDKPVVMHLFDRQSSQRTELLWTDMVGESFERQWSERVWTIAYERLVEDSVGALIFVHPGAVIEAPLIVDAKRIMAHIPQGASNSPKSDPATQNAELTSPYNPRLVATQVQIVELLQFVAAKRDSLAPLRLAVIVSAWDQVEKLGPSKPEEWLGSSLPFLRQYLVSNPEQYDFRIYGVSAQGGDYKEAAALRAHMSPCERIRVVREGTVSHDITCPVKWTISSEMS